MRLTFFGNTDGTYDLAGKEVKKLNYRMHLKIVTHSRDSSTAKGSIGWAKFHENYLEAVIVLPSENIRDFVREVRHRGLEGVRVEGDCNDQGVVAVDMFVFYPPNGTDELLT